MDCDNCYRCAKQGCEAYKEPFDDCWARQPDKTQYIKEQYEILIYNRKRGNPKGVTMAHKSLDRARASKAVIG